MQVDVRLMSGATLASLRFERFTVGRDVRAVVEGLAPPACVRVDLLDEAGHLLEDRSIIEPAAGDGGAGAGAVILQAVFADVTSGNLERSLEHGGPGGLNFGRWLAKLGSSDPSRSKGFVLQRRFHHKSAP